MATVRMTAKEAKAAARTDLAKLDATTEEDIRSQMAEDGMDADEPFAGMRPVVSPAEVRKRTGMSQDTFAKALGIPAATLRNWEQGRTQPDPVALSFFALVADDPERAFKVLALPGSPSKMRIHT